MLDIEIRDITKVFPAAGRGGKPIRAVDAARLQIKRGELFFLLGPSGCGKTTLLRILAGFETPTAGSVLFDGCDVTDAAPDKRDMAMVFQSYALWPHMTVAGNVGFAPKMAGRPRPQRKQIVAEMLDIVGMTDRRHHRPGQLSGGQQQRVALARALAARPKGLLFDEPLSNLDARLRIRMRGEIRRIVTDAGATAVYVTHDQEEALSMADRIAVMNEGRIEQVGRPDEVYRRPVNRFVADFLGEANFLDGDVQAPQGAYLRLDTSQGPILAAGDAPAGAKVTCCVRPEKVRLQPPGPGDNGLHATYIGRPYMGPTCRHELQLRDGRPFAALTVGGAVATSPGSAIQISFSPDDVVVLT